MPCKSQMMKKFYIKREHVNLHSDLEVCDSYTVVVTGGGGFIGHHLLKKLKEKGCRVHIIDNFSNSKISRLDEVKVNTQFRGDLFIHNLDIQDASAVSKIFELERIDTCIHLAAKIDVQDSIVRPSRTIDVNVKGTLNLLEACSKYNVQNFVFASSAASLWSCQQITNIRGYCSRTNLSIWCK